MWHVSSRSGVVTLGAAIHLLLTYLRCACSTTFRGLCVCVIWGLAIATIWRGLCRRAQRETAAGCCWCCWKWRLWLIHRLRFHADLESSKALIGCHTLQFLHRPNLIVAACTKTISWPQCVKSAAKLGRLATTWTGGACAGSSVAPPLLLLPSISLDPSRYLSFVKMRRGMGRKGKVHSLSFPASFLGCSVIYSRHFPLGYPPSTSLFCFNDFFSFKRVRPWCN